MQVTFILHIAIDLFWRLVWNMSFLLLLCGFWGFFYICLVVALSNQISLSVNNYTFHWAWLPFNMSSFEKHSSCKQIPQIIQVGTANGIVSRLPWMNAWPLHLWGPINLYENQTSGKLLEELSLQLKKKKKPNKKQHQKRFYFHTDTSVMIENNAKEKLTTVLLSTMVLDYILVPLNWSWGSFLICNGSKIPAVDCVGEIGCMSRCSLLIRLMFVINI